MHVLFLPPEVTVSLWGRKSISELSFVLSGLTEFCKRPVELKVILLLTKILVNWILKLNLEENIQL